MRLQGANSSHTDNDRRVIAGGLIFDKLKIAGQTEPERDKGHIYRDMSKSIKAVRVITMRSKKKRVRALGQCALLLLCFGHANADDDVPNTGQDPTNPVTRLDIRLENDELPYDANFNNNDSDTLILRADAPIPLGKNGSQGTLSFRVDIPMSSVRTSVPGETGSFELGSVYLQFLHIVPQHWDDHGHP